MPTSQPWDQLSGTKSPGTNCQGHRHDYPIITVYELLPGSNFYHIYILITADIVQALKMVSNEWKGVHYGSAIIDRHLTNLSLMKGSKTIDKTFFLTRTLDPLSTRSEFAFNM